MKIRAMIFLIFFLSTLSASLQAGTSQIDTDFTLGPGDILHVSVWKDEALTREIPVRPDGKISFPLAGEIMAAGRSVDEVRGDLEQVLQRYVPDSPVTVVLTQLQSTRIYVVGKVQRPGMFTVQGEISVLQALALAGGLNRFADEDDIYVLRSSEEEGQKTLPFDYSQVAKGKDLECNIALQPGDTVVVP
jgi:polysaccharide export outer membrane protein